MLRRVNGVIVLAFCVLFAAHEVLGALFFHGAVANGASWAVWFGVAGVVVHVALSVATSRQMLDNKEKPPSRRKKAHLLKKWITGLVLATAVVVHVLAPYGAAVWSFAALALAVLAAVHVCVSSKSLVVDLGLSRGCIMGARVIAIVLAGAVVLALLL